MITTLDDLLARMPAVNFGILAREFLAAREPGADEIAGLLMRVGQLCYGLGREDGAAENARQMIAAFGQPGGEPTAEG